MGEIANMMIEGDMCPCGEYLGDGFGCPQYCSDQCAKDYGPTEDELPANYRKPSKRKCHLCGKSVKGSMGLVDHLDAKHPGWDTEVPS